MLEPEPSLILMGAYQKAATTPHHTEQEAATSATADNSNWHSTASAANWQQLQHSSLHRPPLGPHSTAETARSSARSSSSSRLERPRRHGPAIGRRPVGPAASAEGTAGRRLRNQFGHAPNAAGATGRASGWRSALGDSLRNGARLSDARCGGHRRRGDSHLPLHYLNRRAAASGDGAGCCYCLCCHHHRCFLSDDDNRCRCLPLQLEHSC